MRSFLIISKRCPHCRKLLKWIRNDNVNRENLRVIDIDDPSSKSIKQKVDAVPSLIVEGTNEIVKGVEEIQQSLDLANLILPEKEQLTERSIVIPQRESIPVDTNFRPNTIVYDAPQQQPPPPQTAGSLTGGLYDFRQQQPSMSASSMPHAAPHSSAARRQMKAEGIESDLEFLMEQRKGIAQGIRRIG